jgi:hypothetical protein
LKAHAWTASVAVELASLSTSGCSWTATGLTKGGGLRRGAGGSSGERGDGCGFVWSRETAAGAPAVEGCAALCFVETFPCQRKEAENRQRRLGHELEARKWIFENFYSVIQRYLDVKADES